MKKIIIPCLGSLLMLFVLLQRQACAITQTETQVDTFTVTLEKPENGSIKVSPSVPDGGKVHKGTVITVTASPEAGYAFDGGYFYNAGGWSSNTEDIMRGLAHELVKGGKYVVFSIDYRWIGTPSA